MNHNVESPSIGISRNIREKEEEKKKSEQTLNYLESLIEKEGILSYDPTCVRKKSNWSKGANIYKFDDEDYHPDFFLKDMPDHSPKLQALLQKIEELDKEDMKKNGKLYKHFIFSDLKSSTYGSKLIASAMIAKGYNLGYTARLKKKKDKKNKTEEEKKKEQLLEQEDEDDIIYEEKEDEEEEEKNGQSGGNVPAKKAKKRYHKIELLSDDVLEKTKKNNFYILSSVGVYDQPINVAMKKTMLNKYNQRPENVHGDLIRFIILDSGFKEGIDLFDVKYIHIFEPSAFPADQKQVIGRGTRTCGQKGIEFHPHMGWPLDVFVYDLKIPEKLQGSFMGAKTAMELYMKSMDLDIRLLNFSHDLERTTVLGAVDHDLNKNVHSFSVTLSENENINEHIHKDEELLYGGGSPKKLVIRPNVRVVVKDGEKYQEGPPRKGYYEMRDYIQENFSEFAWGPVKMENLCDDKKSGGSGELIKYTPTQDFIRHYFQPMCPVKGMLINHSVGSGKSCTAIAAATTSFEKNGYTILWVTRTTLKSDIWKNMFNQVCNESIRHQIEQSGLKIPEDQKKRMNLLSKAWRIRPMSYKQFSNLILKQNALYDSLVKINGKEDPLRKTLLIIDEAHKLYGGEDLSVLEKPDMNVLKQAIMYSYQYSGIDSVRLLLMTATPITKDPMELIQLINLCKMPYDQMPSDFSNFSEMYLNDNGEFTKEGRLKYLDDIAGYVSYLNREKDARQFAQPKIHHIEVPIISDIKIAEKFDKKVVQELLDTDVSDLKKQIELENKKIEEEIGPINAARFSFLKDDVCGDLSGKPKSECVKVVNKNIKKLVEDAKIEIKNIREKIKEIRESIKKKGTMKKTALAEVRKNISKYGEQYEQYKNSLLYELKKKCATHVSSNKDLDEQVKTHPVIRKYDKLIQEYNKDIENLQQELVQVTQSYKKRIEYLKNLLKTDLNNLERSVVNKTIRDERKDYLKMIRLKRKDIAKSEKIIKDDISDVQKRRTKRYNKLRNTIKRMASGEKQRLKQIQQETKMLRKTLKHQKKDIKHDYLKGLVNNYRSKILEDLVDLDKEKMLAAEEKNKEKEEKKIVKMEMKKQEQEQKKLLKEQEKEAKKAEKEKEKKAKQAAKEKEKEMKRMIRETKKREREEKINARKTRKNA